MLALSVASTGCGSGIVSVVNPAAQATGPLDEAAYQCPASATAATAGGRTPAGTEAVRRAVMRPPGAAAPAPALLAVTYDTATLARTAAAVAAGEIRAGATALNQLDFAALGTSVRLVAVPAAATAAATGVLRALTGVRRVDPAGAPRYATAVTALAWPNDLYFNGFATTVAPTPASTPPPATYRRLPYVESSDVPGQWDMHAIGLERAFAYALAGNGSGIVNPNASGSSAVKIAIVDTGEDPNHPELAGKIVAQHCYVTDPAGRQSSGNVAADPQGHGTNVTGIAAAATGNGLGFTGAGGATEVLAFRVFPVPDDACATPDATAAQCHSNAVDVATAIDAAVTAGANVISLSLGGGVCTAGADPDQMEGDAVADAIAHGIVVVAAAGNNDSALSAPACDIGVIAVGASALDDGMPNGSGHTGGSAAAPVEYVASYSNSGGAAAPGQPSAWGIVAPGGDPKPDPNPNDPTGATADNDDLHWIENVWTTTPLDATFAGTCKGDYAITNGSPDCRVLIAGTSMATPHVAGVAALVIAVNPRYRSPQLMKQLLCQTADDIADAHEGCGRIDAYRALAAAVGDPAPASPGP
jgi:hypothetical protein